MIFVHGLGGHAYDTWRRKANDGSFWPLWLAEDVEGLAVYTLGYEAPPSNWLGTTMPLQDRAVNVLECLLGETNLRDGPITFICHSLGGLLVKQIVLDLQRQKGRRPEAATLLDRITQVVFLATPHTGSRQGSWLERLRFLAWPSSITRTLVANDPTLRAINVSYRGLADELRDSLHHRIFYETQGTPAGVIVDEASADPGLSGLPPVPVDADHIGIVKPADRSALQYARIRDFVAENSAPVEHRTGFEARPLPALKFERLWNIAPKLLRIALLALVCTIVFKGVQALVAPAPINMGSIERKLDELKALSEQLVAQSATRSVPGAERSVGEAVAAAGQGAAEGDERMKKALALLKENRIAEAEALFRAVAVDRETQAKQNARAAAIAYRNLGAIAGLRDPKRALDAYAKAIERDPDDLESLFWAGWLQRERGDLREAERRFKRVFKLAIPENQAWFIYWARIGIGDVLVAQGSLPEALKTYRDGLAIADRLAQADPGNAGWQRDLSVSYEKIGDVLVAQGNLPAALKTYRDGLAIAERLAQADPGNAGWQRDLSVSYNKIGDVLGRWPSGNAIRQHSRKVKGSNNRRKSAVRLAKLHARIANVRQDWTHQTTTALTERFALFGVENLNVRGMMANDKLARSIADIGFFEFRRQLEYKAALSGGAVVVVDRWFPSSKTCNECGCYRASLPLSIREWVCAECGAVLDRDVNAAKNLQRTALASGSCPDSQACGETGSGRSRKTPVKPASMKQEINHVSIGYG